MHKGRLSSRSNVPGTGHLITYPSNATRSAKNLDVVIVHWSNPLLLQRNRKTAEVCLSCLVIGQRARLVGSSFFFSPFFCFPKFFSPIADYFLSPYPFGNWVAAGLRSVFLILGRPSRKERELPFLPSASLCVRSFCLLMFLMMGHGVVVVGSLNTKMPVLAVGNRLCIQPSLAAGGQLAVGGECGGNEIQKQNLPYLFQMHSRRFSFTTVMRGRIFRHCNNSSCRSAAALFKWNFSSGAPAPAAVGLRDCQDKHRREFLKVCTLPTYLLLLNFFTTPNCTISLCRDLYYMKLLERLDLPSGGF